MMENRKYSNSKPNNNPKKKNFTDNPHKKDFRFQKDTDNDTKYSKSGSYTKKDFRASSEQKNERNRFERSENQRFTRNSEQNKNQRKSFNPNFENRNQEEKSFRKPFNTDYKKDNYKKPFERKSFGKFSEKEENETSEIRLNRFIANAGICSRRNADIYITSGNVEVNGEVMTTLGYRVKPTDVVKFDGKTISSEKKEYILLNKPKGFITTTSDEKGRKTVMELVANATTARILPVGRLDRPTTGLLLLTNDGDLAKKLTHPTHGVRKIYHVVLDKKLDYKDFIKIEEGITLEDGFIQVDEISYVEDKPKNEIGVKIHSGRNRIVRRIFEHLGYNIEKLDRVVFAGLTKKDLPRGHWRRLTQQEIINLKNIK